MVVHKEIERCRNTDSKHFGNARFVTRLLTTQILPNMSQRVLAAGSAIDDCTLLSRIEAEDIPVSIGRANFSIDEALVARTLIQVDALIG